MNFSLDGALEVLERTPATLDALLRGSSPGWHRANEGEGTWSPFEVVGHLVHADETNWVPRARVILEGNGRAFDAFDRFGQLSRYRDWTLDGLLDRFASVRRESVSVVRAWALSDAALSLVSRHPELGEVTLRQLLATWAVHDLDHVAQVVRVMAKHYTDDVGAWRAYLSILKR